MKYMGSKARHAKELLPIILKDRKEGQWYVEPFVGGANMIDKVDGKRVGADINEYLIAMWQAVSTGWMPPEELSEATYQYIKANKDDDKALTAYAAFAMSFGGKWFGGYRRDSGGKRNYAQESYKGAVKQFPSLHGVTFVHKSYDELNFPSPCVIYCDPPYKDTTKYKDAFEHDAFYEWCRNKHKEGHQIFVSEYQMPDDFVCVWSKEVNNSLTKDTGGKSGVEKLFTLV